MLTASEKRAILRSWELVTPIAETAADLFYRRLFELAPGYRKLFGEDLEPQKRKLVKMLRFIVKSIDWPEDTWTAPVGLEDDMFLIVLALGRRHTVLYRVPDESYAVVGEALLWALDYGLGEAFTDETRGAWTRVYTLLARTMQLGRCAHDHGSPPPEVEHV